MPSKTEHVLFCRLSRRQRSMYEAYLQSDAVRNIARGSLQLFAAFTMLRKICNHPDMVCKPSDTALDAFVSNGCAPDCQVEINQEDDDKNHIDEPIDEEESLADRAGKLEVLSKVLPLWHEQGHRVLIFCQWTKMLDIIQRFTELKGWKFGRLDGKTNVGTRQRLVDTFNSDESYFGLLCTTRTGGVGLNLTGANRIVLYDPDWNPQNDAQARERAWRFGQEREVTVYRLITAGTIEEKIYQRQIFKTALMNKVLSDPRQRRLFSQRDLKDLLSLKVDSGKIQSGGASSIETGRITRRAGVADVNEPLATSTEDDGDTLKKVMQSNGLAGVFDHKFVEQDQSNKSSSILQMENHAKRIAREAAAALKESVAEKMISDEHAFVPTWTGSNASSFGDSTRESRFGTLPMGRASNTGAKQTFGSANTAGVTPSSFIPGEKSSMTLLNCIRQQDEDVKKATSSFGTRMGVKKSDSARYTKLMIRIRDYVKEQSPSTDEILDKFSASVTSKEAHIFRQLLTSVARKNSGRWVLREMVA